MQNRDIKLVDVLPCFVSRDHDIYFMIIKRLSLIQLSHGVLRGDTQPAIGPREERYANGGAEKSSRRKHGQ